MSPAALVRRWRREALAQRREARSLPEGGPARLALLSQSVAFDRCAAELAQYVGRWETAA